MMRLAMAAGDDAWVAKNTQDLARDCFPGQITVPDEVIFVSRRAMIAFVDALGGIQIKNRIMHGVQTWSYLRSPTAPADLQSRQLATWNALRSALLRRRERPCDLVPDAGKLFRSFPPSTEACRELEDLLLETPVDISTP
jgi:hypothetical protein